MIRVVVEYKKWLEVTYNFDSLDDPNLYTLISLSLKEGYRVRLENALMGELEAVV